MLDIDYADYKAINSHDGYSVGFNNLLVEKEEFENTFITQWIKYLKYAKGVIINFKIPSDDMEDITYVLNTIDKYTNEECDVIFGTEIDKNIENSTMIISLQITGLVQL